MVRNAAGIRNAICIIGGIVLGVLLQINSCYMTVCAAAENTRPQTVRIGYYLDNEHFQSGAPGERKSGYAYEYYQKIAEYTGWDYEYVYGTWGELEEKLTQGEIDIMANLSMTPERQEEMLFSDAAMGREAYYIYAPIGLEQIQSEDLSTLNGKKIGVTRGTIMEQMLQEYLAGHGYKSQIIPQDDYESMHEAMERGDLDACVLSDNFVATDVEQIAMIGRTDLYFAVAPGREDLLEQLNTAMDRITEVSPYYMVLLQNKYFSDGLRQALTEEEREWLQEKGKLRFGYIKDALPISGEQDGFPTGVTQVVVEEMRTYLGVEVETVGYDSMEEIKEAIQKNELDAAFPLYEDLWLSESKGLYQTDSLVKDRLMLVFEGSYEEELFEQIALSNHSIGQQYYVEEQYPNAELAYYEDIQSCFEAVQNGNVRCSIGCESVFQRKMQENPQYAELNIAYLDDTEDFGIAVNGQEHMLVEILNKMIVQIDTADITNAMIQHSYVQSEYGLKDFMEEKSAWFVGGLAVLAAVLGGIFIAYRKNATYTQRMLQEAAIKASEANKAKTQFLSAMSHDIRTPMNVIVGMTTIASKHMDEPDRVQKCLQNISLAGHHLLTLINDILDISKVESGKTFLNPVRFSLRSLTEEIRGNIGFQAREKNVDFHMKLEHIVYDELYGDELRLNQIFINLLSNAVKYTPPHGKVDFLIRQEKVEETSEKVRLICVVKDTGIGMSREFMDTMYEPFVREKNSQVKGIQGYGLGLTIIHQMVEVMGGEICCQSEENVGTTFLVTLELPVAKPAVKPVEIQEPERLEEQQYSDNVTGKKVLVTEDNELNWEIMEELLQDYDISCDRAENGQVCVDMIREKPADTYAAILMDVQMPVMDGREATRQIRALEDPKKAHIPIIAMTADAFAEDVTNCLACGMDGHIAKPVNEKLLIGMLRQLCL